MPLADLLVAARLTGELVPPPGTMTLAAGYVVATAVYAGLGTPAGWKIGATSDRAQDFLGVGEPIRGRLYFERIWREGDVTIAGDRAVEAEPEIVLRVGAGGAPDAAWFGIELNRSSFADPFAHGAGAIVADNAASVGLLIGRPLPLAALDDPGALVAMLDADGTEVTRGAADAVLGNPRTALAWLAGVVDLRPGDFVATGAMARSAIVARGTVLTLDGGRYGSARFTLK